jgi:hypothetical protein
LIRKGGRRLDVYDSEIDEAGMMLSDSKTKTKHKKGRNHVVMTLKGYSRYGHGTLEDLARMKVEEKIARELLEETVVTLMRNGEWLVPYGPRRRDGGF